MSDFATGFRPASVPPDVAAAIRAYRTCEFATVNRAGVAIAWPTVTFYDEQRATFLVTTSIGLPTKAFNVRREPKVSLLFSDPTGSGSTTQPQILVRGLASCPDVVVADPAGLEGYWAQLYERQPAGRRYGANALTRAVMDWYYLRLVVTVVPGQVEVRPPLGDAPRIAVSSTRRTSGVPARMLRELRHYRTAVLSWRDADGGPTSARVRPVPTADARLLVPDVEAREGPASLLCHAHDDRLWSLRDFVVVGSLARTDEGWVFSPQRFVRGASPRPGDALRTLVRSRAAARRYLHRRGLPRPAVAWDEFAALHRHRHRDGSS